MAAKDRDWDPLEELGSVQKRMNRLFEDALSRGTFDPFGSIHHWTPVADVSRTEEGLQLDIELPGFQQDAIDVELDGDDLIVQGERQMSREREGEQFQRVERAYGKFERRFPLPSDVDRKRIDATYRNGVLEIRIPARGSAERPPVKVDVR